MVCFASTDKHEDDVDVNGEELVASVDEANSEEEEYDGDAEEDEKEDDQDAEESRKEI
jgi:hypothetical protein